MSSEIRCLFLTTLLVVLLSHNTYARGRQCPPKLRLLCAGGVGKRDGGITQSTTLATNVETYRKDYMLDAMQSFRQKVCPFDSVIELFTREQQLELWQVIEDFADRNGLDLR